MVAGPTRPSPMPAGIAFTATDGIEEIVTYTAVDDTDGDCPCRARPW